MTYNEAFKVALALQEQIILELELWDWRNDAPCDHITRLQNKHDALCYHYNLPCELYAGIHREYEYFARIKLQSNEQTKGN